MTFQKWWDSEPRDGDWFLPVIAQAAWDAAVDDEITRLRDQLHLAEVARAAQVEGLAQAAAGWRERANQLEAEVARLTQIIDQAWGEA